MIRRVPVPVWIFVALIAAMIGVAVIGYSAGLWQEIAQ